MRFLIVITILTLLNSYVVLKITNYFGTSTFLLKFLIIMSLVSFQSIGLLGLQKIFLQLEKFSGINELSLLIYRASYLLLGIIQCLFVYNLFADILKIILSIVLPNSHSIYSGFCRVSLPLTILVTLVTITIGVIEIIRGPIIEKVEIILEKLPPSFDGFTIVQISDLHVGSTIKRSYVEKIVNITNSLKPDLIALTGDFVDGDTDYLRNDVAPLSKLHAIHGTFFVTGNHEYYSGVEQWLKEFTNLGIINLLNEHVLIKHEGDQIVLAGVTDYFTIKKQTADSSSPAKAILGAPKDLTKILLAHQPASYAQAKEAGFDLQLSGHTHGGQYFPFTFFIRFFHRYFKGLNNHEGMWIYINRGTGYWGPPLRVGSPSEITLITLRKNLLK